MLAAKGRSRQALLGPKDLSKPAFEIRSANFLIYPSGPKCAEGLRFYLVTTQDMPLFDDLYERLHGNLVFIIENVRGTRQRRTRTRY